MSLPLYTIIPGILVILTIYALTQSNKNLKVVKNPLFFLVCAFSLWFAAEQTWNIYDLILNIDPYPSIADFFYISAPIIMFISLILFLKSLHNKISKKKIIFSSIISIIILIPTLVATYNVSFEDDPIEVFVGLIYPIVDAILLVPAIIIILFLIKEQKNIFWMMMLIGIICFLVADTIFLFLIIDDSYHEDHLVDTLWIVSYVVWAFAMFHYIQITKQQKIQKNEIIGFDNLHESKKPAQIGINLLIVIINITMIIGLASIFSYIDVDNEGVVTLSFILIMIIVVFSSVIIFLNINSNRILQKRTKELEKISFEMIKSEKMLSIGQLASRISHDLRNPLTVIQSSLENFKILYGIDNDKQKHYEKIERSINRMTHQIEDVLDFVREKHPVLKQYSLGKLITESIDSIDIPKNIEIIFPEKDIKIFCDERQFSAVLNNLILNGIQAIDDIGTIKITCTEKDDKNIIVIKDSGHGIPKENLEHVFEPLFTTKMQGTGLGLASVKSIIEAHKGKISLTSTPTTFTIIIPKIAN